LLSNGDTSTWIYHALTGLLSSRTDAQNQVFSYQYDDAGREETRTDARGWVTEYTYFGAGDASTGAFNGLQKKIDYRGIGGGESDPAGTPHVGYTYHTAPARSRP